MPTKKAEKREKPAEKRPRASTPKPTPPKADPLVHLLRSAKTAPSPRPRRPFAAGEHVWLGSRGAADGVALARGRGVDVDVGAFRAIRRRRTAEVFEYGELVALSGDFYGSPELLWSEKPAAIPWLWEDNDLSDLRQTFDVELAWIEAARTGPPSPYPNEVLRQAWNAKWYVELALENVEHFGWHNMVAYCRHHARALELAVEAAGEDCALWREAVVHNAFADHFLTDGFAAGHVRVPRAEIIAWAKGRGWNLERAGALSKLLHDQDGHVGTLHADGDEASAQGLPVVNARGDVFAARCDGQLFLQRPGRPPPAVGYAVEAVARSVCELIVAWKTKAVPAGEYAAAALVPFPDLVRGPPLAAKFPAAIAERDLAALVKSVDWYAKLPWIGPAIEPAHVRALFAALPDLMRQLARSVRVTATPELRRRLPRQYIEAFEGIG